MIKFTNLLYEVEGSWDPYLLLKGTPQAALPSLRNLLRPCGPKCNFVISKRIQQNKAWLICNHDAKSTSRQTALSCQPLQLTVHHSRPHPRAVTLQGRKIPLRTDSDLTSAEPACLSLITREVVQRRRCREALTQREDQGRLAASPLKK